MSDSIMQEVRARRAQAAEHVPDLAPPPYEDGRDTTQHDPQCRLVIEVEGTRTRCALVTGHSGLHEDGALQWDDDGQFPAPERVRPRPGDEDYVEPEDRPKRPVQKRAPAPPPEPEFGDGEVAHPGDYVRALTVTGGIYGGYVRAFDDVAGYQVEVPLSGGGSEFYWCEKVQQADEPEVPDDVPEQEEPEAPAAEGPQDFDDGTEAEEPVTVLEDVDIHAVSLQTSGGPEDGVHPVISVERASQAPIGPAAGVDFTPEQVEAILGAAGRALRLRPVDVGIPGVPAPEPGEVVTIAGYTGEGRSMLQTPAVKCDRCGVEGTAGAVYLGEPCPFTEGCHGCIHGVGLVVLNPDGADITCNRCGTRGLYGVEHVGGPCPFEHACSGSIHLSHQVHTYEEDGGDLVTYDFSEPEFVPKRPLAGGTMRAVVTKAVRDVEAPEEPSDPFDRRVRELHRAQKRAVEPSLEPWDVLAVLVLGLFVPVSCLFAATEASWYTLPGLGLAIAVSFALALGLANRRRLVEQTRVSIQQRRLDRMSARAQQRAQRQAEQEWMR